MKYLIIYLVLGLLVGIIYIISAFQEAKNLKEDMDPGDYSFRVVFIDFLKCVFLWPAVLIMSLRKGKK